jgi:hypothetical protein
MNDERFFLPRMIHRTSWQIKRTDCRHETTSNQFVNQILPNWIVRSLFATVVSTTVLSIPLSATPVLAYEQMVMEAPPNPQSSVTKLADGVDYYDVVLGEGDEAQEGRSVQFLWVLRRANGYFVASSTTENNNEPFIYRVGNRGKVITGIDEAIRGMKVGGIRRISVPPQAGYILGVDGDKPGPLPKDYGPKRQILTRKDREIWKFEIKLLKMK